MQKKWMLCTAALCAATLMSAESVSAQESDRTTVVTTDNSDDWLIYGPVTLRSATPVDPGVLLVKNNFGWARQKGGTDATGYELEVEYGFAPGHEGILFVPVEIGEGRIDGNADLTIGWHWRFMEEGENEDCPLGSPAFAMRNSIRIPSGVDSSGVDYTLRGLMTWTMTPGKSRVHLNPFVSFISGDNGDNNDNFGPQYVIDHEDGDEKNLQYGAALGMDYRVGDDMLFTWDYLWTSRQFDGANDNHALELGLEWDVADGEILAFSTELSLDGNDDGTEFGAKISYIVELALD